LLPSGAEMCNVGYRMTKPTHPPFDANVSVVSWAVGDV
jgi:hypothetical protein